MGQPLRAASRATIRPPRAAGDDAHTDLRRSGDRARRELDHRSIHVTALEQLASTLWIATRPLRLVVGDVGARMTVMGTTDGLLLHSPVDLDDALKSALDELGPVRWLVRPGQG